MAQTPKQIKDESIGKINGALTAIDMYPDINTTSSMLSSNMSVNPIDLIVDVLKCTKGYDFIIDKLSYVIMVLTPALEISVKTILLSNIQNMLSCSIKPIITYDMIKNGVVFDIRNIDLLNIFQYSPIDKNSPGKYYYFGCDEINTVDGVKYSEDLNAVLWYAIKNPNERVLWKRKRDRRKNAVRNISNNGSDTLKQPKSNGIVTIEYNGRSSGLKDFEGNYMSTQEPIQSCIHVFLGCAKEYEEEREAINNAISANNSTLSEYQNLLKDIEKCYEFVSEWEIIENTQARANNDGEKILEEIKSKANSDRGKLKELERYIRTDNRKINEEYPDGYVHLYSLEGYNQKEVKNANINGNYAIPSNLTDSNMLIVVSDKLYNESRLEGIETCEYPKVESDYYLNRTIFEFNTDFVWSTKLFDSKTMTARLVDAITDCFSVNINGNLNINKPSISLETKIVQQMIREMVVRIIESDDQYVNDCFFTFTNDTYNELLQKTEMERIGLHTNDGINPSTTLSAEELLKQLNSLSDSASETENVSIIRGTIMKAVSSTNPHGPGSIERSLSINTIGMDYDMNLNIVEKLLTNLVYVIVETIMSPKIYILLMINLKLMGENPEFDIAKFIQQYKNMISNIIKGARDEIIDYFYKEIMKIVGDLAKKLMIKINLEQYEQYKRLLTHCLDCFKIHRNEYDWAQDVVDYADITDIVENPTQPC